MSWPLTYFVFLLAHILTAALLSSLIYLSLRALEKHFRAASIVLSMVTIVVSFLFVFERNAAFAQVMTYIFAIVLGLAGSPLHRKASGDSTSLLSSLLLMPAVILLATLANFAMLSTFAYPTSPFWSYILAVRQWLSSIPSGELGLLFLVMINTLAAPLLICLWKSPALRPGLDQPFDE